MNYLEVFKARLVDQWAGGVCVGGDPAPVASPSALGACLLRVKLAEVSLQVSI